MGIMSDNYQNLITNENYDNGVIGEQLMCNNYLFVGLKYACEICDEMTESLKKGDSFAECISKLTAVLNKFDKEEKRNTERIVIKLFIKQFILALGKEMFKDRFDVNTYNEFMLDSLTEAEMYYVACGKVIPTSLMEIFQDPELASEVKNFEPVLYGIQESLKTIKEYSEESYKFWKEIVKLNNEFTELHVAHMRNTKKVEERFAKSMKKMVEESGPSGNSNQKA